MSSRHMKGIFGRFGRLSSVSSLGPRRSSPIILGANTAMRTMSRSTGPSKFSKRPWAFSCSSLGTARGTHCRSPRPTGRCGLLGGTESMRGSPPPSRRFTRDMDAGLGPRIGSGPARSGSFGGPLRHRLRRGGSPQRPALCSYLAPRRKLGEYQGTTNCR